MNNPATVENVISNLEAYWNNLLTRDQLNDTFVSYLKNSNEYLLINRKKLSSCFLEIIFSKNEIKNFYYIMSALFCLTKVSDFFYELIRSCITDNTLTKEEKHFIHHQCASYMFLYPEANTKISRDLIDDLYEQIYCNYLDEVKDICTKIPCNKRNRELIVVITSQILGENHAPSKILYNLCKNINKLLHKHLYIINTADTITPFGIIDWFDTRLGNYVPDLGSNGYLDYYGNKFAYFQCSQEMPQVPVIREIMKTISEAKPWCIISVGTSNVTADICSHIIPCLSVPLGHHSLSYTSYQLIDNEIDKETKAWLSKHSMNESRFIISHPTYSFNPQKYHLTRSDLRIPDNKTICVVVGYRLDYELDLEFVCLLDKLAQNDIFTAFVGEFDYNSKVSQYSELLQNHTLPLGFQDDILSVYSCCDIYLNPKRLGGGTSAVEALYKGLPVLSLNYGDVANCVGTDFCVKDYDEMFSKVIDLVSDKEYYNKMSDTAIKKASKLTDVDTEFIRIMNELETKPEF